MNTKDEYARSSDAKASEESSTDNQFDLVLGAPEEDDLSSNNEPKKNNIKYQVDPLDLIDAEVAQQMARRKLKIFLIVILIISATPLFFMVLMAVLGFIISIIAAIGG